MGTSHEFDPARYLGRRVGNYVISDLLGCGGMGVVYLARHPELDLQVAIKVLPSPLVACEDAARRFLDEARAAARLAHPGVVRIHDFGRFPEGGSYYVMEALAGRSLAELRGPFSPAWVLACLEQLCPALQQAHDRGVVHRDLKPSNIFAVSEEPLRLKVLDFGIAKLLEESAVGRDVTGPGLTLGTPQFMAPEQAAGHSAAVGPATDLYAVGVICYQLLSGRLPIEADSPTALLFKQVTAPPVSLLEVAPQVPPAVARVVHHCLEKDPGARPAGAMALLRAFTEAVEGATDAPGVSSSGSTRGWVWIAALGLGLLVGGVALVLRGASDTPRATMSASGAATREMAKTRRRAGEPRSRAERGAQKTSAHRAGRNEASPGPSTTSGPPVLPATAPMPASSTPARRRPARRRSSAQAPPATTGEHAASDESPAAPGEPPAAPGGPPTAPGKRPALGAAARPRPSGESDVFTDL